MADKQLINSPKKYTTFRRLSSATSMESTRTWKVYLPYKLDKEHKDHCFLLPFNVSFNVKEYIARVKNFYTELSGIRQNGVFSSIWSREREACFQKIHLYTDSGQSPIRQSRFFAARLQGCYTLKNAASSKRGYATTKTR